MIKTKLVQAIAMATAGAALSVGGMSSAAAHVMYNTWTSIPSASFSYDGSGNPTATAGLNTTTDGWTYTDGTQNGATAGSTRQAWAGIDVATQGMPFGYVGHAHLNWAAAIHSAGQSLQVSQADAWADYSTWVELDTGAGAWQDASTTPTGWKHQTEIGLIKSDVTQFVTLKPSLTELAPGSGFVGNFGITVFDGMDTISQTGPYNATTNPLGYSHHGRWNCPTCTGTSYKPYDLSNPFSTAGVTYLQHDGTVDAANGLTFLAQAGQVYSIYLGGAGVGTWSTNLAGYKVDITTSAVPIPAAVWLFGSALAGLGVIGRRKPQADATA